MKKAEKNAEPSLRRQMLTATVILAAILTLGWYIFKVDVPRSRSVSLDSLIVEEANRNGLSPALVKAVIWRESKFKASMVGSKGEIGLMQLLPRAAVTQWQQDHNLKNPPPREELFQPATNIAIGTWYLAWCGKHWDGYQSKDILQLAEYNAGRGNARKWRPKNPQKAVRIEDIPFKTTRKYIRTILERKALYEKDFDAN